MLLCVYPTRIYRRLSQLISTRKQLAITAFAEALHNCFKDGLNGTRDYRASAGLVIMVSPLISVIGLIVWRLLSFTGLYSRHCVLLVSYVRPCKSTLTNISLSYHGFMLGVIIVFGLCAWEDNHFKTESLELAFVIIPLVSHILVLCWALYVLYRWLRIHCCSCLHIPGRSHFGRFLLCWRSGYQSLN